MTDHEARGVGERNEWVEFEGRVFRWPFCTIPGCPNRICTGRSDRFCWPHSSSGKTLDELIEEVSHDHDEHHHA